MLITKFMTKYGDKNEKLQAYIDNEVNRFITANRLTEGNLRDLDEKIQLEKYNQEKKAAIMKDR